MKKKETNKSKHVKQIRNASTDFEQDILNDSDDDDNVVDDDSPVDVWQRLVVMDIDDHDDIGVSGNGCE